MKLKLRGHNMTFGVLADRYSTNKRSFGGIFCKEYKLKVLFVNNKL